MTWYDLSGGNYFSVGDTLITSIAEILKPRLLHACLPIFYMCMSKCNVTIAFTLLIETLYLFED